MKNSLSLFLFAGVFFISILSRAQFNVDTFYFATSGMDARTYQGSSGTNYGSDTLLKTHYDYGPPSYHSQTFMQVDLSSIPAIAVITDARLNLYAKTTENLEDHPMVIDRVTSSWTEGGITYSTVPTTTSTGRITIAHDNTANTGWQRLQLTGLAQYAVANPSTNYGWRLALSGVGTIDKGVTWKSSENATIAHRPYVIVTWHLPTIDTIYVATGGVDARVYSGATSTNYGSDTTLRVNWDYGPPSYANRTFIKPDYSSISREDFVVDANLYMYAQVVDNSASHPIYVENVTGTWTEGGITWANQPAVTASSRTSVAHAAISSTGWHVLPVKFISRVDVNAPDKFYGWRISLQSESGTTDNGIIYASSEHDTVDWRPYVIIEHQPPITVSGYVTHCTGGNDDGAITVSAAGGCESFVSYRWRKLTSGTLSTIETGTYMEDAAVSDLADGLYLFDVTDYKGGTGYRWFFVGEEGVTTNVGFYMSNSTARVDYTEDALVQYIYSPVDSFITNGGSLHYGCLVNTSGEYSNYAQYFVDWDPSLEFTRADHALNYNAGHYQTATSDNDAWISRIVGPWDESSLTWAIRPGVTTTDRFLLPGTTTIGFENRNDTLDILGFVPYWQQHPDESFGYEMAIQDNPQPAQGSLGYGSSDHGTINHNLMVSFTVRPQIETNWVDSLGRGSITVNAIAGELPYKYLISYDTLPVLDTIWYAIRDSLPPDIDSAEFYSGQHNTRNYVFSNLPNNHYWIGVYDNNGFLLMNKEVFLGPDLVVYDSTDLEVDGDTLLVKAGETEATATLFAWLPEEDDGGFELKIVTLDDELWVGLDNIDDAFPAFDRDYRYLFKISSSGKAYVRRDTLLMDSVNVSVGDMLKLYRDEFDILHFYKNGIEFASDTLVDSLKNDFKVQAHLKGADAKLLFKVQTTGLKKPKLKYTLEQPGCGDSEGTITITVPSNTFFGPTLNNYVIKDESGATVASGSSSTTISLPPGYYTVHYHYTIASVSYAWYEQFIIGYKIIWANLDNITEMPGTFNSITPTNLASNGTCNSANAASQDDDNWIRFYTQGKSPNFGTAYERMQLENQAGDYVIKLIILEPGGMIISKFVFVYDESSFDSWFIGGLDPFRIVVEDNGDVELFHGTVSQAAFASSVSGNLKLAVEEYKKVRIDNAIASFCYPVNDYVAKTKSSRDGSYFITNDDELKFQYTGEYNESDLVYELTNEAGAVISTSDYDIDVTGSTGINQKNADNRYTLDMNILPAGFYLLTITNEKGEEHYLRIKN
jgi:hypothetical protein